MRHIKLFLISHLILLTTFSLAQKETFPFSAKISVAPKLQSEWHQDGRLILFFTKNQRGEPRYSTWPSPSPSTFIFAKNLSNVPSGAALEIGPKDGFMHTSDWDMANIPAGDYYVQVVWDQDNEESRSNAPGNLYSDKQKITIGPNGQYSFIINNIVTERKLVDHELVKMVNFRSDTLSKWWGKDVYVKASVLLPHNYDAAKKYPIRYNVAGYGGRYDRVNYSVRNERFMSWWTSEEAPEVVNVYLDGEGPFGDSYQMDSDNSGPYGYSLIYELIPHIEKQYRHTDDPTTRFVDGCSTGGWVSLGLQLYYPDHFGGCYSYSPDAVEFENYQLINLYRDENAYTNEYGYPRPVMRSILGEPMIPLKKFVQYENVLAPSNTYVNSGGQFSAHNALYGPKGENGLPKPIFDPTTGQIDTTVAQYWEKYDFKKYAEKNWATLGPKIQGKIYVWMGDMDHFYLNMATRAFDDFLKKTTNPKSDAVIEFKAMSGHCQEYSQKEILTRIQKKIMQK